MSSLKETIAEVISKHVSLEDTYTYELKRAKAAFQVGTMSLEDFEEWTDENVDDLAKEIVDALQPQLNENQQIVLDFLKTRFGKHSIFVKSIFDPISDLLSDIWIDDVDIAFEQLDLKQEIQVLEVFSQWVQEQEEE